MHISTAKVKDTHKKYPIQTYIRVTLSITYAKKDSANWMTFKSWDHGIFKEYSCKLSMGKRQSPETKVRSCVRNSTKHEFNSFNKLVNEDVCKCSSMACIGSWFILLEIFNFIVSDCTSLFLSSPVILLSLVVFNLLKQFFSFLAVCIKKALSLTLFIL